MHPPSDGGKRKPMPNGVKPSTERVIVNGRKRTVYVGPKGGRYIKRDGKFVRLI
jgi:hypothetical protein